MRKRDPESRYRERIRHEQQILEDFAVRGIEYAADLLMWYNIKKQVIPDDQYRAVAFFKNREYLMKPGSLTLLHSMYQRLQSELAPITTKENAFDILCYQFSMYAAVLEKGGY